MLKLLTLLFSSVCLTTPTDLCKSWSLLFYQNLALCTAALMYILSRDRLNMDLDRACLELMIKLLEFDQDHLAHQDQLTAKEVEKVKEKIRKLCETVHNKHLDLENITVGCTFNEEKSLTSGCTFIQRSDNLFLRGF